MEKKTARIMMNVMAALHTFGVEYDTNFIGYEVERRLSDLLVKEKEIVDYIGFDGGDKFKTKLDEFVQKPHYYKVRGAYWATTEDDKHVVIQLSRLYEMDSQDWVEYANWCGCEDPLEAQCNYGDPPSSYIRMNVRIEKGHIESFVRRVARACWDD